MQRRSVEVRRATVKIGAKEYGISYVVQSIDPLPPPCQDSPYPPGSRAESGPDARPRDR